MAGGLFPCSLSTDLSGLIFPPSSSLQWVVSDPSYVLSPRNMQRVLDAIDYVGAIKPINVITSDEGLPIRVSHTFGGDGSWRDNEGHMFVVDTGLIGLFPRSICVLPGKGLAPGIRIKRNGILINILDVPERTMVELGFKFDLIGMPHFECVEGVFKISDATGRVITIDTSEEPIEE